MGLDGGTIISRNDVLRRQCADMNNADTSRSSRGGAVRGVLKRKRLDAQTTKATRWSTCALSGERLAAPVVACFLGHLYNKAAVLELLLARAGHFADEAAEHRYLNQLRTAGDAFDHIANQHDVFALQYESAAAGNGNADEPAAAATASAEGGSAPEASAPFTCPLTSLRCDRHAFAALRPCGHVFSERALREVGGEGSCPTCGTAFSAEEDVISLLPPEEQLEGLRQLLPEHRRRQKQQQKRKRKREAAAEPPAAAGQQQQQQEQQQEQQREPQQKQQPQQQQAA